MSDLQPVMLVVDDDPTVLEVVRRFGERRGFDAVSQESGRSAIEYLRTRSADIALVDVRMPEVDGFDVLRKVREAAPSCRVVLMTGSPDMGVAVEAIKLGAQDVIPKPLDFSRLSGLLARVHDETARRRQVRAIERHLAARLDFHGMVGRSAPMEHLFSLIQRLAPHVHTVVVSGETGTGKELVARALHALGPRARKPLVAVNCSAIVPTLVESELFGHVRGAFTGATDHKPGMFEVAHNGTLFLDEIAELPLDAQAKLLRVLENREVQRVGSTDARLVDVHLIAATNRPLAREVEVGRFRADLFYRLQVVELPVPPLRERREDIPFLVAAFMHEFARVFDRPLVGVTPEAERVLTSASWDGNVRELRNTIERACLLADGEWVTEADIILPLPPAGAGAAAGAEHRRSGPPPDRTAVESALTCAEGNKTHAAARLGVSRRALYRLIEHHGLA